MDRPLLFDFTIDKVNNSIHIKREFKAGLQSLWSAWTQSRWLDQWWAPKPYRTITKSQDLNPGGTWLYYMLGPENEMHWCKADYIRIEANRMLSWLDAFCDEEGNESTDKPRSHWTVIFSESGGITTIDVTLKHDSLAEIEQMISMGFKEGFSMAMGNLEELFPVFQGSPAGESQAYFHGTKAELTTGDLIKPGFRSNYGSRKQAKYAYFSALIEPAVWGAELAEGEGSGRIYQVEPTGPYEDDPNLTDKRFPGNPTKSYRTKDPLRVITEVTDWQGHSQEQLQAMKDALEKLRQQGVEAIEE